ncbi:fasciclin domain-containing protein [Aureibaculum marinum]|uniref:Fasciclin domain-containing protein n=1 Tax=Aureibaculum marinum TaxID=2487930 RepID=A0A3N4P381_9FLAO|nr:fasciclin domain-containing protein [Aureibaculum marinum]RPE00869.1 fasciclin domain-containing protein [Aureibaculum marinum]
MKKQVKLVTGLLIIFFSFTFISCDDDDDPKQPEITTITDFVKANEADYSLLLEALTKADGNLSTVLDGAGPFTVFAPNDAAFTSFLSSNGFSNIDAVPSDILSQILLNHVVSGAVKSTDLSTGYIKNLSTATPGSAAMSMYINTDGGVTINGSSVVTNADNILENGVVHLVDNVIGLPNVVTFATADPNFSILVAALTRADQPDFVSILSTSNGTSPAPFTVFAPTNDAFVSLLDELEVDGLDDIDGETLTATLQHHVVAEANVLSSALTDNMTINTLGGDITANVTGGATLTDANDRVSSIVAVDVQAANGVIHVIDKVILPLLK